MGGSTNLWKSAKGKSGLVDNNNKVIKKRFKP